MPCFPFLLRLPDSSLSPNLGALGVLAVRRFRRIGANPLPKIDSQEPQRAELEHFFDCIEHGTPCLAGPEHALKVVQILSTAQSA